MMISIGFDTSNYTTSVAAYDGSRVVNCSKLLEVRPGELGLRQSDALFAHIKNLPALVNDLFCKVGRQEICCIGVSTRPRAIEGSYMPCFLAGTSAAHVLGSSLNVPLFELSHQHGHIAAAIYSSGRTDLYQRPFLAWHLSGGTTELLLAEPEAMNFRCTKIGGTTDISAGQTIDRTGKLLGLSFPSGKAIDSLSAASSSHSSFKVKCTDSYFSLSGLENKINNHYSTFRSSSDTASYALRSISRAVKTATEQALEKYPEYPVLFSGGVSSNSMIRRDMRFCDSIFGEPVFSTDNAAGIAILAYQLGALNGK